MTTLPKIVSEIMDTCHHASEKCMFGVRGWSKWAAFRILPLKDSL